MGSATGLFAQWEKSVGFGDSKVMFDRLDEWRFCESVDWEGKKLSFLGVEAKNAEISTVNAEFDRYTRSRNSRVL